MNILSWMTLVFLAAYALNGLRRGLIRTVFATFTMIVAIAAAVNIAPYVSRSWQNTAAFDITVQYIERTLFGEEDITDADRQEIVIDQLPLPAAVKDALAENNNAQYYKEFGITEFKGYLANYLACLIARILSFVIVYVMSVAVLKVLASCLDIISHLPVLHTMNKLGGCLMGLVNGMVILWIICMAITVFSSTELGHYLYSQIHESTFLEWIYDHNYLIVLIADLM